MTKWSSVIVLRTPPDALNGRILQPLMGLSPTPDASAEVLLARIRTLYAQLNDAHSRTPEYERLTAEIHELAIAYSTLVRAGRRINRPDTKP